MMHNAFDDASDVAIDEEPRSSSIKCNHLVLTTIVDLYVLFGVKFNYKRSIQKARS